MEGSLRPRSDSHSEQEMMTSARAAGFGLPPFFVSGTIRIRRLPDQRRASGASGQAARIEPVGFLTIAAPAVPPVRSFVPRGTVRLGKSPRPRSGRHPIDFALRCAMI